MRCPKCGGSSFYRDDDGLWLSAGAPLVCFYCGWNSLTKAGPAPEPTPDPVATGVKRKSPPPRDRSNSKPKPRVPLLRQVADAIDRFDPAEWDGKPTTEAAARLAEMGIMTTDKGIGWALNHHSAIWRTDKSNPHRRRNEEGRWVNQAVLWLRSKDFEE